MAENVSATAWNVDAPEDSEYINRIPKEMRFLRGAVESVIKEEHTIVETGNVITSAKHKMGAGRAYAGAYAGTGGAPANNPGGNALSTVAETAQVATCEVGRMAIDTAYGNRLYSWLPDADATAVWTGIAARPIGTAMGTMYMNEFPVSGLRTAVLGSHAVPAAQFAGTTIVTDADGQFYANLSSTSFATGDGIIELATGGVAAAKLANVAPFTTVDANDEGVKLVNGFEIRVGEGTLAAGVTDTIVFATAFSNGAYCGLANGNRNDENSAYVTTVAQTHIIVCQGGGAQSKIGWVAFGY